MGKTSDKSPCIKEYYMIINIFTIAEVLDEKDTFSFLPQEVERKDGGVLWLGDARGVYRDH